MTIDLRWPFVQAMASIVVTCANAQFPLSLDTMFRTLVQDQYVSSLLLLPDGNVLLSGAIRFPGDMSVRAGARLDPFGTKDPSFPAVVYMGGKITPWADRLYVGNGPGLRRMWMNGLLDNSFNMVDAPYFSALQGGDYHVFPDGRVLMSGAHMLDYPAGGYDGLYNLIWFTNTGYLDTTRVHRKGNGVVYRFEELPDGKFICGGTCTVFDSTEVDWIFRVHPDGSVDTTFNTGVNWGGPRCYLPLSDGRVYAGGNFRRAGFPNDTLRLVRFMPDGTLDPAFNAPSFTLGAIPSNGLGGFVFTVQQWGSDQLMVTGRFQFVDGQMRKGLCVLDTTGALMDEFDGCGVDLATYMGSTTASVSGLVQDADSTHYYIWGRYNGYEDGTTNDTLQRFVTRLHVGDITTGLAHKPALQWSVYPNPTSGAVTLALDALPRNATIVVRDALGRGVLHRTLRDHYTTLDLQALGNGIYSMELYSDHERVGTQRVVVQR